jgi:hypothetical protein
MDDAATTVRAAREHKRVYDLIWSQMPYMQNRMSSSWWFFLLFPEQGSGYGPKQLMYTIATRAGEEVQINGVGFPGLDLNRPTEGKTDLFSAMTVGWHHDGTQLHHELVKQPAWAKLSSDGYIEAWAEQENGERHGGEIRASQDRQLGLKAHFKGANGEARFETWGDLTGITSSPHESINLDTPLGGTHFIAWRRIRFSGEFRSPGGTEQLQGIGYFQRVCMNVPTFPWKWFWCAFEDGTVFSAFVPYVGLQLFRKGYKFLPQLIERATISLLPAAFVQFPGESERVWFNRARITPLLDGGAHPQFAIHARSRHGDTVHCLAKPYGHTRFYIDRPLLKGLLNSHWNYNEYMVRILDLDGRIGDRPLNQETMGNGFASLEYTWGLGL